MGGEQSDLACTHTGRCLGSCLTRRRRPPPQHTRLLYVDGAQLLHQLKLLREEAALAHRSQHLCFSILGLRSGQGGRHAGEDRQRHSCLSNRQRVGDTGCHWEPAAAIAIGTRLAQLVPTLSATMHAWPQGPSPTS